jgi:hypothetical protein
MTTDGTTARATAKKSPAKHPTPPKPEVRKDEEVKAGKQGVRASIPVPHVPVPRVALPHISAPRVPRPSLRLPVTGRRGEVLWLGGLATVAAFGVIDWPVAGAIAIGAYVAEQRAKAKNGRPREQT